MIKTEAEQVKLETTTVANSAGGPSTEEIAERAYLIWERSGGAHGNDRDNWLRAEAELLQERAQANTGSEVTTHAPAATETKKPARKPGAGTSKTPKAKTASAPAAITEVATPKAKTSTSTKKTAKSATAKAKSATPDSSKPATAKSEKTTSKSTKRAK